jgi:hypothetical protein
MKPPIRAIFSSRKTRPPLPEVEVAVDDAVAEASQRAAVEVGDLHLIQPGINLEQVCVGVTFNAEVNISAAIVEYHFGGAKFNALDAVSCYR